MAARGLARPLLQQPVRAGLAAAGLLLFISCYWTTLQSLLHRWNTDPNYSHGYIVPLVSLYLWHQASSPRSGSPTKGGAIAGTLLLTVSVLLLWMTTLIPSLIIENASMLFGLLGATFLVAGWAGGVRGLAPVLFLVFMVPWPSKLYSQAAFPLQLAISKTASVLLTMLGIPVLCDGSLLHLPGQTMHVAEACSGMRQLTAFLAMAAATALLVERPGWYRATILAAAVPVALVVNIVRVTLMALAHHAGYGEWTKGTLHTLEGMIMIFAGFAVLMGVVRILDWILIPPGPAPNTTAEATP
jgi:exosortase